MVRSRVKIFIAWREKVQENGPVLTNGLPQVEPVELMPFFEDGLGDGYSKIDLSAFNWNRSRQSGHKLDPVGVTQNGQPIKRERNRSHPRRRGVSPRFSALSGPIRSHKAARRRFYGRRPVNAYA